MKTHPSPTLRWPAAATVLMLAASLLATGTASAAAPAAVPHPAAPIGGCAVTQDATQNMSKTGKVSMARVRTVVERTSTKKVKKGWTARTRARITWRGTATVTANAVYASADCGVEATPVSATASRTSSFTITLNRNATRPTKKAARAEVQRKLGVTSRARARYDVVDLAADRAALKARTQFLATLPTRNEPVILALITRSGKEVCPAQPARSSSDAVFQAREKKSDLVPQFTVAGAMWACTYLLPEAGKKHGKVVRTRLTGAARAEALDGIRGLVVVDPRISTACTAELGPTHVIGHVTPWGRISTVVMQDFGCRNTHLSADLARDVPGVKTSRGVPSGRYRSPATLQRVMRSAAAQTLK